MMDKKDLPIGKKFWIAHVASSFQNLVPEVTISKAMSVDKERQPSAIPITSHPPIQVEKIKFVIIETGQLSEVELDFCFPTFEEARDYALEGLNEVKKALDTLIDHIYNLEKPEEK